MNLVCSVLLVLVSIVGVYSNCGCLKCNRDRFQVVSQPGVKIIYKTPSCPNPSNLPYTLQIPVPAQEPYVQRFLGYQIQAQKPPSPALPPAQIVPSSSSATFRAQPLPCPIKREYNVQIQVPYIPKAEQKYYLNLEAHPDRVLLPEAPPDCGPSPVVAPAPISIEPVVVEANPDVYYVPNPSSCGCLGRYDRNILFPFEPPQIFQNHHNIQPIHPGLFAPFYREPYNTISDPTGFGMFSEDKLKYHYNTPLTALYESAPSFLGNFGNNRENFLDFIHHIHQQPERRPVSVWNDFTITDSFQQPLRNISASNIFSPYARFVKDRFQVNIQEPVHQIQRQTIQLFREPLASPINLSGTDYIEKKKSDFDNKKDKVDYEDRSNKLSFETDPLKISLRIPQLLNINDKSTPRKSVNQTEPALLNDHPNKQTNDSAVKTNKHVESITNDTSSNQTEDKTPLNKNNIFKRSFQNIDFLSSPRHQQITYSEHYLLTQKDSKPALIVKRKTILLSNSDNFKTDLENEDPNLENTIDAFREKRAINMKLLALKPEFPPKFLRKYSNRRNERVSSPFQNEEYPKKTRKQIIKNKSGPISLLKPKKPKKNLKINKSNAILKSKLKIANKKVKDWFTKSGPLDPPELQVPSYPDTVSFRQWWMDDQIEQKPKKNFLKNLINRRRYTRALRTRDEDVLPYFTLPKVNKKISKKDALKAQKKNAMDPFLEPFNFNHILHPTPMLHLLNTPIRLLNHVHNLRSHVNPVVGTIPKVMEVSKKYLIELFKNLGKDALKVGTKLVKNFTKLKKLKHLPKLRHKRSALLMQQMMTERMNDQQQALPRNDEKDLTGVNNVNTTISNSSDNYEELIEEIVGLIADILQNHLHHDSETIINNPESTTTTETNDDLSEIAESPMKDEDAERFVQFILGSMLIKPNGKALEKVGNSLLREKRELASKENYHPKRFHKSSKSRRYRSSEEDRRSQEETKTSENNSKDSRERQRFLRDAETPQTFMGEKKTEKRGRDPLMRKRRSELQNLNEKLKKSTTKVYKKENYKTVNPSELDVSKQIIKDDIDGVLQKIEEVQSYDILEDFRLYKDLLQLEDLKQNMIEEIVQSKFKEFFITKMEAENLKKKLFKFIIEKLYNEKYISSNNWIKLMIALQKFHCVIRNVNNNQQNTLQISFLKSLTIAPVSNEDGIVESIKASRKETIQDLNNNVHDLNEILFNKDDKNIKKVAKIIWAINNTQKLQKDSIVELHKKITQGLQVRKELKILFDLQRQLEKFEDERMALIENLEK